MAGTFPHKDLKIVTFLITTQIHAKIKEFTFNFIMCIEGKSYRVEAVACQDDLLLSDQYRPEYARIRMWEAFAMGAAEEHVQHHGDHW